MIATATPKRTMQAAAVLAVERCRELATVTDAPAETTRTFLSNGMRRANDLVSEWMTSAGLVTRIDAAGNLRARRRGAIVDDKTFILASHLDTVPNAGAYDGILGVVMALALIEGLGAQSLPFAMEVIAFSEEEGVRFGVPFLGSRALVGQLDQALLSRVDRDGISVREAIQTYGLNVDALPEARLRNALGYLEFHIEQGPWLEHDGLPVGVVETIAGQSRFELTFNGRANHAGTTPMHLRQDAMSAAAEWIVEVERYAKATRGLVATVGSVIVQPGAGNVIAGEVRASLDVRSALDAVREDAVVHLLEAAKSSSNARRVTLAIHEHMQQTAVPLDKSLLRLLEDAVDATGTPVMRMVSGAGHDAMVVAPHMPAAMLFLRSPGGISHSPKETVNVEDVAIALEAGANFLNALADRERVL